MKVLVLALPVFLVSAQVRANGPYCTPQDYSDHRNEPDYSCPGPGEKELVPSIQLKESVVLMAKEPAPWDGILLDGNRVLTLGLRIKALRRIRWNEGVLCRGRREAEVSYVRSKAEVELNLRTTQRDVYKKQARALQEEVTRLKKWYRSGPFWFAVGVVTATAGTLAAVFAAK